MAAAQTGPPNRAADADDLVERVMQPPMRMAGLSFSVKQGRALGDSVAAAIARRLRLEDLANSETAVRVLDLLEIAFYDPKFIQSPEDKKPGMTLILLDYLAGFSPDGLVRERASKLIVTITRVK
jgi:hypothetical protein